MLDCGEAKPDWVPCRGFQLQSIPVLPKPARLRPRLALQQHQFLPLGEPRGTRVGQSCKVCRRVSQSPSDMTTWRHTCAFLGAGGPTECPGCRVREPGHDAWNLGGGVGTDTLWRNGQRLPRHAIRGARWRRYLPTRPVAVPGLERQASNGVHGQVVVAAPRIHPSGNISGACRRGTAVAAVWKPSSRVAPMPARRIVPDLPIRWKVGCELEPETARSSDGRAPDSPGLPSVSAGA